MDLSYWSVWRGSFAIGQSAIKHSASDTILAIQNHVGGFYVFQFPFDCPLLHRDADLEQGADLSKEEAL